MIFPKSGRKKARHGATAHRESQEAKTPRFFKWGAEFSSLIAAFVILSVAVTKSPKFPQNTIGYDIDSQTVALKEIRSDIYFQTEDLQATKVKRDEAAAQEPETYRVDRDAVNKQLQFLDEEIDLLLSKRDDVAKVVRKALLESNSSQTDSDVVTGAVTDYAARLMENDPQFRSFENPSNLAVWLLPAMDSVPKRQFVEAGKKGGNGRGALRVTELIEPQGKPFELGYEKDLARLARDGLKYVLTYGVIARESAAGTKKNSITIIRELPVGGHKVTEELPAANVPTPEEALDSLVDRISDATRVSVGRETDSPVDWTRMQAAAVDMAKRDITETLFYDQIDTERARERAQLAVDPVLKEIRLGKVLQRSGDDWTAQSRSDVHTYWAELDQQREPISRILAAVGANMIFVLLVLACLTRSIHFLSPKPEHTLRNLNLALLVMAGTVALGRIVSYFEPSGLVVPMAAGAILVTILLNPRIAIMASFMTATLVSIQYGYDWRVLIFGCGMSAAGIFSTYEVRRRSDMTSAAIKATVAGILVVAAITLGTETPTGKAAQGIMLVLLNGGMCILIVPAILSPLERLFRITTDIQLLEYSDLNNELLSRMAIEMPATYAHSLMLGQIAEAAAEAIGANGLLARVCAYYHDIGKMRRPEYFSENQTGVNVHDEMPPRLSARAIASHVAYGAELAREYRLPKPIVDGIREHHGTGMIGFFYQQAVEQHRHHDVQEKDFRYPGPKPQSRETAILMICDAVESGVRSIRNPNEDRVREFVDKIVSARANDRQFDECGLTLKDLDTIKQIVALRVATSLHPRIAYPERMPDKRPDNVIPMSGKAQ